jgi:tRNA-specific 2-thiouridylase
MKILVGLSGGVDSAIAAYLLKKQGHEVIGAMMSIWDSSMPKPKNNLNACFGPEDEDIESATEIAKTIDIPFEVIDCRAEYKQVVLEYFKDEYKNGKTPNPCVRCNAYIKFGVLPNSAKKKGLVFDKFATGHYANIILNEADGLYQLHCAKDKDKDQTYFLYKLNQKILSNTLFPLASYDKSEIRKIAKEISLKVSDKPDSQDFYCGDYNDILNFPISYGDIVDKTGKKLGKHKGIWNYTIGKRRGLGISSKEPLYVIDILPKQNIIIVGSQEDLYSSKLSAHLVNWCSIKPPEKTIKALVKIRQQNKPALASIDYNRTDNTVDIVFDEPQMSITPGQSAVFYQDDMVLGGAIISSKD